MESWEGLRGSRRRHGQRGGWRSEGGYGKRRPEVNTKSTNAAAVVLARLLQAHALGVALAKAAA